MYELQFSDGWSRAAGAAFWGSAIEPVAEGGIGVVGVRGQEGEEIGGFGVCGEEDAVRGVSCADGGGDEIPAGEGGILEGAGAGDDGKVDGTGDWGLVGPGPEGGV